MSDILSFFQVLAPEEAEYLLEWMQRLVPWLLLLSGRYTGHLLAPLVKGTRKTICMPNTKARCAAAIAWNLVMI